MASEDERRLLPKYLGVTCLGAALLAWLLPVSMLPFVNVLPYLQTKPTLDRVAFSAVCYLTACLIVRGAMTDTQWTSVRQLALRTWKDMLGVVLGLLMAIFLAAELSGNTFGLLVLSTPSEQVVREYLVVESKRSGSNYRATTLILSSTMGPTRYEVVLSKRIFGDIRDIDPGDRIVVEADENVFGAYVRRFTLRKH